MDRRSFALTANPIHLIATYSDGTIRCWSRKGLRLVIPTAADTVLVNDVALVWRLETALSATSAADFVAKTQALIARTGNVREWLSQTQLFPQRKISGEATGASSTVWQQVNAQQPTWLAAAETITAESFHANDDAAGSGIRTIRVTGLDANHAEISEVLSLTALTTGPASSQSFYRVNSAEVVTVGTDNGANSNSVYVRTSGPNRHLWFGSVYSASGYGVGQATGSKYTVPAGYTAYVTGVDFTSYSGANSMSVMLWSRPGTSATEPAKLLSRAIAEFPANLHKPFAVPLKIPEKTDLWLMCLCDGVTCVAQVSLFLVPL